MQASASTNRFGFNRFNVSVAAIGIVASFVAGIVTGIVGQSIVADTTKSSDAPVTIVRPKAYHAEGMGEGRLSGSASLEGSGRVVAPEGRREGITSRSDSATSELPIIVYVVAGMGEGLLGEVAGRDVLAVLVTDVTESALDHEEADTFPGDPRSPDITRLELDRDGADLP